MIDSMLAPIPERDFLMAHRAVTAAYTDNERERSFERTMGILLGLFPRKSMKPAKVMMRMRALMEVLDHPLMKAWTAGNLPEGGVMIHETVLRVAARHPVSRNESDIFEPETFFAEVLKRSKRAGSA